MIEEELLKLKFKAGSRSALCRIYEKYQQYLLTLAMALLNDSNTAEYVLHDVFVSFAKSAKTFRLHGSLKGFLATCVINRTRDRLRLVKRAPAALEETDLPISPSSQPYESVICSEESKRLNSALASLPYEQREAVVLHITGQMKFSKIARLQNVSVNTVQGRYRYGLKKLRSILDREVKNESRR